MIKECPECGAPLRDDLFCDRFCDEYPEFPPIDRIFDGPADGLMIGMGEVLPIDVKRQKRFQFEAARNDHWVKESEIIKVAINVLATNGRMRHRHADDYVGSFMNYVTVVLNDVESVEIIEVLPTAWDLYEQQQALDLAAVRIGPGKWFAAGRFLRTAIPLLLSILYPIWAVAVPSVIALDVIKGAYRGLQFGRAIARVLVTLPPESIEFQLLEAVHLFSHQPRIVNYIIHENNPRAGYGQRPPTTEELAEATGRTKAEIDKAFHGLRNRGVVTQNRQLQWCIVF